MSATRQRTLHARHSQPFAVTLALTCDPPPPGRKSLDLLLPVAVLRGRHIPLGAAHLVPISQKAWLSRNGLKVSQERMG